MQLSEQEVVRREKLAKLRELGINPYPADLFPIIQILRTIKTIVEGKRGSDCWTLDGYKYSRKSFFCAITRRRRKNTSCISIEMKFVQEKTNLCTISL